MSMFTQNDAIYHLPQSNYEYKQEDYNVLFMQNNTTMYKNNL